MKKTLIMIILSAAMLLSACADSGDTDDSAVKAPSETTVEDTGEDTSYLTIERYKPNGYEKKYFGFSGSDHVINLIYPKGWTFSRGSDGSTTIMRDGSSVGILIKGKASDTTSWEVIKTDSSADDGLTTNMWLERSMREADAYRVRYEYSYKEGSGTHVLTLICDYAELNDFSLSKMLSSSSLTQIVSDIGLGDLSDLSGASSIALLGNSFIGSSDIGYILSEMLENNGKNVYVDAISRGYATVETYISDTYIMSDIRNGLYDAVFICGFYSSGEIDNLGVLKSACDYSGTKLIIFPAHNENAGVVSSACSRYSDLYCLDWKAELDMLISTGVDRWDLCTDDAHDHSTPLAGYVGAHMIYRAMYSKVPTADMYYSISQSYIDSILGDYSSTGGATLIEASEITNIY